MTNPRGTRWETAVVKFGLEKGLELRRAVQAGREDVGDIHGLADAIIQAKDAVQHELAKWVDDAERQAYAAGVPWGVVVLKRRRGKKSSGSVGSAYAFMSLDTLFEIFADLAEGREALEELDEMGDRRPKRKPVPGPAVDLSADWDWDDEAWSDDEGNPEAWD